MEGHKNFEYGGGEDFKEEIRNQKLRHGHMDLGASEEAEEAFEKSFKLTHEKNKEFIDKEIEKFRLEILEIDKELENYENKETDLYTKIKDLNDELSSTTVYVPGYDSLAERINAVKGEFEKNAEKLENLKEDKKTILNKITSFYKQMENQAAVRKAEFGGLN